MPELYTPRTDQVRAVYVLDSESEEATGAAFDRWLAEHDREVAKSAIVKAAEEFRDGHQGDKPRENYRMEVPRWLIGYAIGRYS